MLHRLRLAVAAGVLLAAVTSTSFAQLPTAKLDGIFPAGGKPGTTVDVTVVGADLDDASQLHFSHPGIKAERKMAEPGPFDKGPQPLPNQFVVTIAPDVPLGNYDVRAGGKYGVSNPRTIEVHDLADVRETEPNNQPDQATEVTLPAVINGQINGGTDVDLFKFTAQAGQRLLLDCKARRIDSPLDPLLILYDATGRELANSRARQDHDPLIDLQIPATGEYRLRVVDTLYRGGADYVYRVAVGPLPYIDFVFPPAGLPGTNGPFTLYGRNLPGGQPTDLRVDGRPLEKVAVNVALPGDPASPTALQARLLPEQAFLDCVEHRVANGPSLSNPAIISLATAAVVPEVEPNGGPAQAQKLAGPCEVAGQFFPQRDADWFSFDAKQGEVWTIEVISQRLGCPTDPLLVVQQVTKNEQGVEQVQLLASVDETGTRESAAFDTRSGDPYFRLVTPADATYRVLVRDGYSETHGDPRLVYRLAIRPEQPDFRLVAVPRDPWNGLLLRKGGRESIDVMAWRRDGCDAPITVSVQGLPAGVTSTPVTIGPASNIATLVLTAADSVAPAVAPLEVRGTATLKSGDVTRVARLGVATAALPMMQPNQQPQNSAPARVGRSLVLSISTGETEAVALQTADVNQIWETARGGILKIPYSVTRRNSFNGGMQGVVTNLPPNVNQTNFNVGGGANSGEIEIRLRGDTAVGTYTVYAATFVQGYSYSRNPEAAQAAAERKAELDKIAVDTAATAKAAADALAKANAAATAADNALKATQQTKATADKAAADATTALAAADEALTKAKAASAAQPEDVNLKNAVTAAEKAQTDAAAKAKVAAEAAVTAQKAVEEGEAKAKTALEEKLVAEKTSTEAAALAKAATDAKTIADRVANETKNASNPRNINYWTPSTPITIKVTPAPVTVGQLPAKVQVKQGANVELPIPITRLYGYVEQVNFQPLLPNGVSGLQIQNFSIPQNQATGKLTIAANAAATPGLHNLNLRITMNNNGQQVQIEQVLPVEVEEVKPEEKK